MKNITTAIMTKFTALVGGSHTAFYNDIGGRLYKLIVPQGSATPLVWYKASARQADTFGEDLLDVDIEFHLISQSSGTTEIEDMLTHLNDLYNDATFTITSNTLVQMNFVYADLEYIPADTDVGSEAFWEYVVDYMCVVQRT